MSTSIVLPPLELEGWRPTRDALWSYARCIGAIRRALNPPARHWSHISLAVGTRGVTTGPMMASGERFEIRLDIRRGQIVFDSESGQAWAGGLPGTSASEILDRARAWVARSGGGVALDIEPPEIAPLDGYDRAAAERYWMALSRIEAVMSDFAGGLRGETFGPQLWPHHFDLAVLWLSGRRVPGEDAEDESLSDESLNFGFSTGDETIRDPYFYATSYPSLAQPDQLELPAGASWHTEGWQGIRMDYADLAASDAPGASLHSFLTRFQREAAQALRTQAESA